MDYCNGRIFFSVAAAIVLMLLPVRMEKIDAKIDVFVVLQYRHTTREEKYEMNAYKKLAERFGFEFGKAKFGIVFETVNSVRNNGTPAGIYPVILALTPDLARFKQRLDNYTFPNSLLGPGGTWQPLDSIDMLKRLYNYVFIPGDVKRAVVYIATDTPSSSSEPDLRATAVELRNKSILLLMYVPNRIDEADNSNPYRAAELLTERRNIFVSPGPDYDSRLADDVAKNIGDNLLAYVCEKSYDEPCYYEGQDGMRCMINTSTKTSSYPYVNDPKQCDDAPTAFPCPDIICMDECKKYWPPDEKPNCTDKCGNITHNPRGTPPTIFHNCPQKVICQPCPTTPDRKGTNTAMIVGIVMGVLLFVVLAVGVTVFLMKEKWPEMWQEMGFAKAATAKGAKKALSMKKRSSKIDLEKGKGTQSGMGSKKSQVTGKKKGSVSAKKGSVSMKKGSVSKKGSMSKKKESVSKKQGSVSKKGSVATKKGPVAKQKK